MAFAPLDIVAFTSMLDFVATRPRVAVAGQLITPSKWMPSSDVGLFLQRIDAWNSDQLPIYEPGLKVILPANHCCPVAFPWALPIARVPQGPCA